MAKPQKWLLPPTTQEELNEDAAPIPAPLAASEMHKALATFGAVVLTILLAAPVASTQGAVHTAALDITHDKPFVMVMVNGKGPFRFVVDTGTGGEAFITRELADQLGLSTSGQIHLSDPSGQGAQKVPMVVLHSLRVAGVEFTGVKAAVHNLSAGDGYCQGLLGFLLFRHYLLTLDYPNRRMQLSPGELAPDGGQSVLPFRMPDGIPVVSLAIGATYIDAQIDSGGAGLSLPLRADIEAEVRLRLRQPQQCPIPFHAIPGERRHAQLQCAPGFLYL